MSIAALRMALGALLVLGGSSAVWAAEESGQVLPTLLIKGEVVSVDTNDPAAALLKVRDRYGFETPIYLAPETKISKGEASADLASLATGAAVEVEYNFDVNTAKRHAVTVKLAAVAAPAMPAAVAPPPVEAAAPLEAAVESATPMTDEAPAAPAEEPAAEAAPAEQETAPAGQ
ncbi:MAG: hypothetical protein HY601_02610 [Candidatus Omnitrophica bacterium]|nr:hypothetical protein [Candidatus Omnitrophota bacterium]